MKVGLVLGGGGMVGLAYHAGALRGLEEGTGFVPDAADLMIGTSAGSVAAAYLRSGWTTSDLWELLLGVHPSLLAWPAEELAARQLELFAPAFRTPFELARAGLGSLYVMSRALWRWQIPLMPPAWRRLFPGGLFDMPGGQRRFAAELPSEWPERPLWLCALDLVSGRRVVLGRPNSPPATLHQAVLASCAVPGLYPPVEVGPTVLVDGGAHSSSNLDLAVRGGCELIIGIAPMAYDTAHPPSSLGRLARRIPARLLAAEAALARRREADVLLLCPSGPELRLQGVNLMRLHGLEGIAAAAYESTLRAVRTPVFRQPLEQLAQGG